MKITIVLDGEGLLAFERAFARSRLADDIPWRRYFAYHLLHMAADSVATAIDRPVLLLVGRFDFRYWNEEERCAHYAMHKGGVL